MGSANVKIEMVLSPDASAAKEELFVDVRIDNELVGRIALSHEEVISPMIHSVFARARRELESRFRSVIASELGARGKRTNS